MPVETLGEAWNLSWKIHIRCLYDGQEGLKRNRACGFRCETRHDDACLHPWSGLSLGKDRPGAALSPLRLPGRVGDVLDASQHAVERGGDAALALSK